MGKSRYPYRNAVSSVLGRELTTEEWVHHVDCNRRNNALSNLVLTDREGHENIHQTLRDMMRNLLREGLVAFDRPSNTYVAVGKLRELLEQPEEANQQPSLGGDTSEGSTTRHESH